MSDTPQQPAVEEDDFFAADPAGVDELSSGDSELDLTDVDEDAGFKTAPAGVYNAHLTEYDYGPSQRSGKNMITWVFELTDGDFAGIKLRYYTVVETESGLGRLKKMLVRIAPTCDLKRFRPASTPGELIGTLCRLKVRIRMYEGQKRNDIQDVLAPATASVFAD